MTTLPSELTGVVEESNDGTYNINVIRFIADLISNAGLPADAVVGLIAEKLGTALFGNTALASENIQTAETSKHQIFYFPLVKEGATGTDLKAGIAFVVDKTTGIANGGLAFAYNVSDLYLGDVVEVQFLDTNLLEGIGFSTVQFVLSQNALATGKIDLDGDGESDLDIEVSPGMTLLGELDLADSKNKAFQFISQYLGLDALTVAMNINEKFDTLTLKGAVETSIPLFDPALVGLGELTDFNVYFKKLELGIQIGQADISVSQTNTLQLQGYDPTQANEPELNLIGKVTLEPESLTIAGALDTAESGGWRNPFGLPGRIDNLAFQIGATYNVPYLANLGFVIDLKWLDAYDLDLAVVINTQEPQQSAFSITLEDYANVAQLLTQVAAMSMVGVAILI